MKDASATAIYGDRAANGVIVVERKKVTDSKLRLRYNFVPDVQFADVSSFDLCNPRQKLELEKRWGIYEVLLDCQKWIIMRNWNESTGE